MFTGEVIDLPTGPQPILRAGPSGRPPVLWLQDSADMPVVRNPVAAAMASMHEIVVPYVGDLRNTATVGIAGVVASVATRCATLLQALALHDVLVIGHRLGSLPAAELYAERLVAQIALIAPPQSSRPVRTRDFVLGDSQLVITCDTGEPREHLKTAALEHLLETAPRVRIPGATMTIAFDEPIDVIYALQLFAAPATWPWWHHI